MLLMATQYIEEGKWLKGDLWPFLACDWGAKKNTKFIGLFRNPTLQWKIRSFKLN